MAEDINYNGVTIERSWSLMAFAKENGLPEFCENVNKETGEEFNSLVFPDAEEGVIFCHLGHSTQNMTMEEIEEQADQLKVGLNSNGKYTLYKRSKMGKTIKLW